MLISLAQNKFIWSRAGWKWLPWKQVLQVHHLHANVVGSRPLPLRVLHVLYILRVLRILRIPVRRLVGCSFRSLGRLCCGFALDLAFGFNEPEGWKVEYGNCKPALGLTGLIKQSHSCDCCWHFSQYSVHAKKRAGPKGWDGMGCEWPLWKVSFNCWKLLVWQLSALSLSVFMDLQTCSLPTHYGQFSCTFSPAPQMCNECAHSKYFWLL